MVVVSPQPEDILQLDATQIAVFLLAGGVWAAMVEELDYTWRMGGMPKSFGDLLWSEEGLHPLLLLENLKEVW